MVERSKLSLLLLIPFLAILAIVALGQWRVAVFRDAVAATSFYYEHALWNQNRPLWWFDDLDAPCC